MARPNKTLTVGELSVISEAWFALAVAINGKDGFSRDLTISGIDRHPRSRQIETRYHENLKRMSAMAILNYLGSNNYYRGVSRSISEENTILVSRLTGYALGRLHKVAEEKNVEPSVVLPNAHAEVIRIHHGVAKALEEVTRRKMPEREAHIDDALYTLKLLINK